ncbi:Uma2 family endonuclease [Rubrivirga sp. S365]|uniref:Uma2 family endonuclease n=1 Tax=Rubrivirga litoralis TaxID=3075598 RepID=A0ABU3BTH5_9BACT|nr:MULTISPECIES: Uma2 family endonuclease [unclassified Rubrivirga]MDT0632584.1 Uma2 family endonuclease [Rubrivirga sp. F394]MDT7856726.1 Uma2 family endonuclease [Rubrivirga sp. S365]
MSAVRPARMTVEEYLAFDAAAPEGERYEYWDGVVVPVHGYDETGTVAMAGASPAHNQVVLNLSAALHGPMTQRGWRGGVGDQRVRTEAGRYSYPDLVFTCDEPQYTDDNPAVLLNPTLLVEIVSPSTVGRDRGAKLRAYAGIESLVEYWIVEVDAAAVTRIVPQPEGGALRFVEGLDAVVESAALGLAVPLADVYRLVDLP